VPFNPPDTWNTDNLRIEKPITSSERRRAKIYGLLNDRQASNDITVWRSLYYTKPENAGMGRNPFERERWNLSHRQLGIVKGVNMNTEHEFVEERFSGSLLGLRKAEDYCIKKLLAGEDDSYHILVIGSYNGEREDNFMESLRRNGNGWW